MIDDTNTRTWIGRAGLLVLLTAILLSMSGCGFLLFRALH